MFLYILWSERENCIYNFLVLFVNGKVVNLYIFNKINKKVCILCINKVKIFVFFFFILQSIIIVMIVKCYGFVLLGVGIIIVMLFIVNMISFVIIFKLLEKLK